MRPLHFRVCLNRRKPLTRGSVPLIRQVNAMAHQSLIVCQAFRHVASASISARIVCTSGISNKSRPPLFRHVPPAISPHLRVSQNRAPVADRPPQPRSSSARGFPALPSRPASLSPSACCCAVGCPKTIKKRRPHSGQYLTPTRHEKTPWRLPNGLPGADLQDVFRASTPTNGSEWIHIQKPPCCCSPCRKDIHAGSP